ncbi:HAD family hydrolase [Streptomyces sp. NPDC050560]|uniref:HAD family hydrolase n=1 Tax=Streptomyces sp. NPDC050560 TaxID=3365630 RepID=UPI0037AEB26B
MGRTGPTSPTGPDGPPAAEPAVPGAADAATLRALVTRARAVLFDFDGPICRLFAGHRAERVAGELVEWVESRGLHGLVTPDERQSLDPHRVLRAVDARHRHSDLVTELEQRLTEEEMRAAASAWPTAFADPLIRTWAARGARLTVATNNSPLVVRSYLTARGLLGCFEPHVYGRTDDLQRLKPHPHCLTRALNATGTAPGDALMIGDSPADLAAARTARVPFLGYARSERKAKLLREAGAEHLVASLEPLLHAVRDR